MRDAFTGRAIALPPCASGNVVAIAVTGPPVELERSTLASRARALRAACGLDLASTVAALAPGADGLLL